MFYQGKKNNDLCGTVEICDKMGDEISYKWRWLKNEKKKKVQITVLSTSEKRRKGTIREESNFFLPTSMNAYD